MLFQKGNKIGSRFKKGHKINKGSAHTLGKHWKIKDTSKMKKYCGRTKGYKIKDTSKMHTFKKRDKNPNWQGGISFEPYTTNWTVTLRESIRQRDNYICRLCGRTQEEELEKQERKLSIHHIDYDKKNCNPNNLITLCVGCNTKVNHNRKHWINYFKEYD